MNTFFSTNTHDNACRKRGHVQLIFLTELFLFKKCVNWNDTGNDHTGGSGITFITHYSFLHQKTVPIMSSPMISHPKCFQMMNFHQLNLTAAYARELSQYCRLSLKKIKCQLIVRLYFLILSRLLSRTIKTKNEIEYQNKF